MPWSDGSHRPITARSIDAFNTGGLSDRSVRGTQTTRDIAVTGSWTETWGAHTSKRRAASSLPRAPPCPAPIATARAWRFPEADFGSGYIGNSTTTSKYVELGDTIGHSRGSHFLESRPRCETRRRDRGDH